MNVDDPMDDPLGVPSFFKEKEGGPNGLLTGVPAPDEAGEESPSSWKHKFKRLAPILVFVFGLLLLAGVAGFLLNVLNERGSAAAATPTQAAEGETGLSRLNPLIPTMPVTPTLERCTLPSPPNGASTTPVTTTLLIWSSASEAGEVSFDVYFGTAEPLSLVSTTEHSRLDISSFALLTPNTTYYWRIVTRHDESGAQVEGDTWAFTTEPVPPPTPTAQGSMASLEITGPASYPGDLPYLGHVQVALSRVAVEVPVELRCNGAMTKEGAPAAKNVQPEGVVTFLILLPPHQTVTCRVVSNGQECGQWDIKPGQEGETALLECVVFLPE